IYRTEREKYEAIVNDIIEKQQTGRPVLVGTVSIEKSEHLSEMLRQRRVPHQVLNAKYHEKEAAIIAQAGRPGTVTIATNMAGRGVDILLGGNPSGLIDDLLRRRDIDPGAATPDQLAEARRAAEGQCLRDKEKVLAQGGLHILGTERHEARRIDNQLRGRSGRQGDPGSSRFYVSLEDELMRRFGGANIASIMDRLGLDDDVPIEHGIVSRSIENAQTKVEGYNFDIRKHLVEYDDVMNKQREVIYAEREKVLTEQDLRELVLKMVHDQLEEYLGSLAPGNDGDEWDLEGLFTAVRAMIPLGPEFHPDALRGLSREELFDHIHETAEQAYARKEQALGIENMRQLERLVVLQTIDRLWVEHLTALDDLRQGIGLRAYGQQDPLIAFKSEAYQMFEGLKAAIQREVAHSIFLLTLVREAPPPPQRLKTNRDEEADPEPPRRSGRKVGRNDPCPCGSGRKYKKCHGR
ncbi:MAG TPA: SEC-C metal-binding domain-containing protein, partial [Alphaproteobacteria bacterium]|nr:SEC-C metal-binding domain-containing protein [Alphaproteobacteria bacterium]